MHSVDFIASLYKLSYKIVYNRADLKFRIFNDREAKK